MNLSTENSMVLVIDIQGRLAQTVHRSELVLAATDRLLQIADLFEVPVLVTEQYPQGLGPTAEDLLVRLNGFTGSAWRKVEKESFSCCGAPQFEAAFEELLGGVPVEQRQVIVAGIEAHICVVQTVLGLLERGIDVHVCWECVSGRGAEYREWALQRMLQAGATITNHESVAFEWAGDKNHPTFRAVNRLLREGQVGDSG